MAKEKREAKAHEAAQIRRLRIEVYYEPENESDLLCNEPVTDGQLDYIVKHLDGMKRLKAA